MGCGDTALAELLEAQGSVERDYANNVGEFHPATVGAAFHDGDGLRTGKGARAVVRIGTRSRANVESDTTIRFSTQAQANQADSQTPAASVALESGSAVIETGDEDLPIVTSAGRAVLRRGSRVQLERTPATVTAPGGDTKASPAVAAATTRYRVLVGGASFTQADGKTVDVTSGQSIAVGIGLAVLDPIEAPRTPTPAAPKAAEPQAEPSAADTAATDAAVSGADPVAPETEAAAVSGAAARDEADIVIALGESFRVYDPKPPTVIGFKIESRCPSGAELSVPKQPSVRGTRELRASLPPGTHAYTVRCLNAKGEPDKVVGRGFARVLRGDGARPLPKSAPRNSVDLDGRRYTLMYQNLRPILAVTWPDAPKAGSYTLTLRTPDGRTTTSPSREPRVSVPTEALLDGAHTLSMTAGGKQGARSKETTVDIMFDNAAPTASIESPSPQGFERGSAVKVSGVALEGSRISVGGEPITLDKAHRFSEQVALQPDQASLAIRFQHSAYGVRYYLRRALRGTP